MPDRAMGGLTGIPRARKGGCDGSYAAWEGARAGGAAPAHHHHETPRVKGRRETTSGDGWEAAEGVTERTPRPDKSGGGESGWHAKGTQWWGMANHRPDTSHVRAVPMDTPARSPRRPTRDGKRACDGKAQGTVRAVDRAAPRQ